MTPFCHRCAQPLDARAAFCPACGVPQIRVIAPEPVSVLEEEDAASPLSEDAAFSASPAAARSIDWKGFVRISLPLAFLSGILTVAMPPLGLALLPGGVILGIARYRRDYEASVTPSQGGWLGACTGLLSFSCFLVCDVVYFVLEQSKRDQFHEWMHWMVTPARGFFLIVLVVIALLTLFVALATVTGSLAAAISWHRNRR
jgi:hypothetical protein